MVTDELLRDELTSKVDNPAFSQPICTALQIALIDLFASWQIWPSFVIGHSSGEIAAAYCAGGLSRESAYEIAYYRGLLAARLATDAKNRGAMLSVALPAVEIDQYLATIASQYPGTELAVGCLNSPNNTTVTGSERSIDALKATLDREKIFARKLKVGVAYHSPSMEKVGAEYALLIKKIVPGQSQNANQTRPAMYSSVTGHLIEIEQLSQASYWVKNMVSKVNFLGALTQLCTSSLESLQVKHVVDVLIEVGPHAALRRPIKDTLDAEAISNSVDYDSALIQGIPAPQTAMEMVGRLHCKGHQADLVAINSPGKKESQLSMLIDLPGYPFNHSQSYWLESRLSKDFRFRRHGRHELLGTPSSDWNPFEAKWRNIIKVNENPWIKDHTVRSLSSKSLQRLTCSQFNGLHLYPAAGMIVMALEAARQIANPALNIQGYRFKDVVISRPLLISLSPEGVETQIYLRPRKSGKNTSSRWSDFRLYTYSNDEWAEVCSGTAIVEYQEDLSEVENGKAVEQELNHQRSIYERGARNCWRKVDTTELYSSLETFGMSFGPTFQTLSEVAVSDEGEGCGKINVHDWIGMVPTESYHSHVIHPTALDGIFHLTIVALSKGASESIPTMMPTQLRDLWISNSLLTNTFEDRIKVYAKTTFQGYREADFSIVALNTTNNEPQIVVEGYRGTATSTLEMPSSDQPGTQQLCLNINWKPDLETLESEQASAYCAASVRDLNLLSIEVIDDMELICLYFMFATLQRLPKIWNAVSPKLYFQRYINWMKHHCDKSSALEIFSDRERGMGLMHDEARRESLLVKLESSSPEGRLFVTVGRNLDRILCDKIDTLELLFSGNLVQDFYSSTTTAANYAKVASYVDLLAHKDPGIKILEIGAGTGGATACVLDTLCKNGGALRCSQYDYTDISQGFFEEAKKRFSYYADRISYKLLDIESDPALQEFDVGEYDLVISSNVCYPP